MYINDKEGKRLPLENVRKFVIYGDGKILFSVERFEQKEIKPNRYGNEQLSDIYGGEPVSITLSGPVKNARKENLMRRDNYTLNYSPDYMPGWIYKALYIHVSEIAVDDLGDVLAFQTDDEKNYLHAARLTFSGPVMFQRLHAEKIPCGGDWKIPDGGRWGSGYGPENMPQYDVYDTSKSPFAARHNIPPEKGVIKRWYTYETIPTGASIICTERYYTKMEESDARKKRRELAETINKAAGLKLSHYDIEKLEKVVKMELL